MSSYAETPRLARTAFITPYAFELVNGGRGIVLSVTDASQTTALVGEGRQVLVTNDGNVAGCLFFGGAGDTADTACTRILPDIPYTLTIPKGATHVSYICPVDDGTTTINIVRGYGQ